MDETAKVSEAMNADSWAALSYQNAVSYLANGPTDLLSPLPQVSKQNDSSAAQEQKARRKRQNKFAQRNSRRYREFYELYTYTVSSNKCPVRLTSHLLYRAKDGDGFFFNVPTA